MSTDKGDHTDVHHGFFSPVISVSEYGNISGSQFCGPSIRRASDEDSARTRSSDAPFHFVSSPTMATPKKRIPLNGPQAGFNSAFAQLHIEGLPEGPQQDGGASPEGATGTSKAKPGRVVLRRLSAHRGGKTVFLVDGFGAQHADSAIEALGRRLRAQLGCGGTFRDRALEIQGDQAARLRALLEQEGFQVAGER